MTVRILSVLAKLILMFNRVVASVRDANQSAVVKKPHRGPLLQCRSLRQHLWTGAKLCETVPVFIKYEFF